MSTTEPSFAARVEAARRMVADGPTGLGGLPPRWRDQFVTATDDAHDQVLLIGHAAPLVEPHRNWRQRTRIPDVEASAYLVAAVLDCMRAVCPHLRKGGPQPAYARLALRRVDCERCVATHRAPPPEDADRCDMCGRRSVPEFVPLVCQSGPTVISGDVCPSCAAVLNVGRPA